MPKIVERIKFRKQFTSSVTGKLESIYWGYLTPSDAARSHEYTVAGMGDSLRPCAKVLRCRTFQHKRHEFENGLSIY